MIKFFKNFGLPILETVATLALAVLPILIGWWLRIALAEGDQPITFELALATLTNNLKNFGTPIPYFGLALLAALVGRLDGLINRYRLGELKENKAELQNSKKAIRDEAQAHAESKSSYLETLGSALKYLLTSKETGFDYRCRVTIYRLQQDQDQSLRQIFRHSPTKLYEDNGRIRIPIDEGIVGAAWGNHGVKEFTHDASPDSEEFVDEMKRTLEPERCRHPDVELSMPSKHYYARAFDDHDTGRRVGVVVYESTEAKVLDRASIDQVLDTQTLDVSRFIRHLGILHREFNPDTGEEQA